MSPSIESFGCVLFDQNGLEGVVLNITEIFFLWVFELSPLASSRAVVVAPQTRLDGPQHPLCRRPCRAYFNLLFHNNKTILFPLPNHIRDGFHFPFRRSYSGAGISIPPFAATLFIF